MERHRYLVKLRRVLPDRLLTVFKKTGLRKYVFRLFSKGDMELAFQTEWAEEFKENRDLVLDYWRRYRYLDEITDLCCIKEQDRVLDVGCGISSVLHFIDGLKFGIDPLFDEYRKAYNYPEDMNIQKGCGEKIPFPDGYFDGVFCSNVLDHVNSPEETISEIDRVLKEGGFFILTVEVFDGGETRDPAHPHCLTRDGVRKLANRHFIAALERESPWVGLRSYVKGRRKGVTRELIMVLRKRP